MAGGRRAAPDSGSSWSAQRGRAASPARHLPALAAQVYEALSLISVRDFKAAAALLIDSVATFTAAEICPYERFICYAVLSAQLALDRPTIKAKVVDAPEILAVINSLPHINTFLNSLCEPPRVRVRLGPTPDLARPLPPQSAPTRADAPVHNTIPPPPSRAQVQLPVRRVHARARPRD